MKKKRNKWKSALAFLTLLSVSALFGFYIGKLGMAAAGHISETTVILMALLFIPAFLIVIGIHEGGHALAGIWMNFDFLMYVVGPFMWNKEQGKWKFQWNRNVNTAGGMVLCLPSDTGNLNHRFSIYAAGGPAASLLLAALAYGMYLLISTAGAGSGSAIQIISYFFLMIALLSAVIFVVTAIPLHMGGFSSDGARVWRLKKGGDPARFEVLLIKIIADSSRGIRPKNYNMAELLEAQTLANKLNAPFGVYLHGFLHQAALDSGDMGSAEAHLLNYINEADEIPAGLRNMVWLDAAFFYAFVKNDLEKAASYWNRFKHTAMIPKALVYATEAALAFLKNEKSLGTEKAEASLKEIPGMIDKGLAAALKERLLYLLNN